jgi:hypothetical protein
MSRFLLAASVLTLWHASAAAEDHAGARAILDKAIAAHGGEAALSKIAASRAKFKGTGYQGNEKMPVSYEWAFQGLDKMRTVSLDENGKPNEIEVLNGAEGWCKEGGKPAEAISEAQRKSRSELIYVDWISYLTPLKGTEFRLTTLPEITVAGHKASGVLVHHPKHDDVKLYFDNDTHMLVKYDRRFDNVDAGKVFDEETTYSEFREVNGTKQAFKIATYWDGTKVCDGSFESIELFDKPLDDKLFAKP